MSGFKIIVVLFRAYVDRRMDYIRDSVRLRIIQMNDFGGGLCRKDDFS
jgi:hypothetical protein